MLNWADQFNIFSFLDTHGYEQPLSAQSCLLGAGAHTSISCDAGQAFNRLQELLNTTQDWIFGHLSYELKNETESLVSKHKDGIGFDDLRFFVPDILLRLTDHELLIGVLKGEPSEIWDQLNAIQPARIDPVEEIGIHSRFSKEEYIDTVEKIRAHIHRGDCYELNFCQEFYAQSKGFDPIQAYSRLSATSPNPFSALYKNEHRYLICASPERYLCRRGQKVYSQPIKGTAPRILNDPEKDLGQLHELKNSSKERAENIMVVDLVRNDLSRVCVEGSVRVEELCEVYSFPQVHQMISTISGQLPNGIGSTEVLKHSFPMGSMTGAPKRKVLELIERYEKTKRGLFSGAVGYFAPDGDFDFNVVIRSLFYNDDTGYLSFQVGSGITYYANAAAEYEECLLKAEAIKKVLTGFGQH